MADKKTTTSAAEIGAFFESIGRSLAEAQGVLAKDLTDIPAIMAIAEAELEIKAAIESAPNGKLSMQTISVQDIRQGGIDPNLLSSVRLQFVPTASDALALSANKPTRKPDEVLKDFRTRKDIVALGRILGDLTFDASYIPERKRWIVTARDSNNNLLREALLPD
jgi:hypothetical protein